MDNPVGISEALTASEAALERASARMVQDGNAFYLVEAMGPQRKTVYARDYHRIQDIARMRKATYSQPLWLQVIHDGNCGNSEKPGLPELGPRDVLLTAFGRPADKAALI